MKLSKFLYTLLLISLLLSSFIGCQKRTIELAEQPESKENKIEYTKEVNLNK